MKLKLSLAQLVSSSAQEIVLAHRHGSAPEAEENELAFRQQWYRSIAAMTGRELAFDFKVAIPNGEAVVSLHRFYHHNGELFRLALLDKTAGELRANGPKQREVNLLALAANLIGRRYKGTPKEAHYMMHVLGESEDVGVVRVERYAIPAATDEETNAFLATKILAVAAAMSLSDEDLQPCDSEQMAVNGAAQKRCLSAESPMIYREAPPAPNVNGVPQKCLQWCPCRFNCAQRRRYLELNEEILFGVQIA